MPLGFRSLGRHGEKLGSPGDHRLNGAVWMQVVLTRRMLSDIIQVIIQTVDGTTGRTTEDGICKFVVMLFQVKTD